MLARNVGRRFCIDAENLLVGKSKALNNRFRAQLAVLEFARRALRFARSSPSKNPSWSSGEYPGDSRDHAKSIRLRRLQDAVGPHRGPACPASPCDAGGIALQIARARVARRVRALCLARARAPFARTYSILKH
jgi:hypothetical protein